MSYLIITLQGSVTSLKQRTDQCLLQLEHAQTQLLEGYDACTEKLGRLQQTIKQLPDRQPIIDTCKDNLRDLDETCRKGIDKFIEIRAQILDQRHEMFTVGVQNVMFVPKIFELPSLFRITWTIITVTVSYSDDFKAELLEPGSLQDQAEDMADDVNELYYRLDKIKTSNISESRLFFLFLFVHYLFLSSF